MKRMDFFTSMGSFLSTKGFYTASQLLESVRIRGHKGDKNYEAG